MPFSQFGTSVGAGLLALSFLIALLKGETKLPKHPLFLSLMALFAWTFMGLAWTNDFTEGLATVNIKLPLLIFPLALFTVKWDSERWLKPLGTTFLVATSLSAIAGLFNGFILEPETTSITKWTPFISHIRMGLLLSLGTGILLLEKRFVLAICYGALAMFSLWHTQSITGVLMMAFVLLFAITTWFIPKHRTIAIGVTIFSAIFILSLSFYLVQKDPISYDLPQTTPWGNTYTHSPSRHLEENGYKVWNNLCDVEVQKEWNKRSDLGYYSQNHLGHTVRDRVIRYMTSLGVPKNGEEVLKLSDQDIENIEIGHTSIRMSTHSGLSLRMDDLKFELGNYLDGGNPSGNSVTMRLEAFKTGVHIITSDIKTWLFGVGTGDLPKAFEKAYIETESKLRPEFWKRTHNQYLAWWIALGVIGTVLWIIVLMTGFSFVSDIDRLAWWILAISCLAEDTLETQAGVTFAAIALTLFASSKKWKS